MSTASISASLEDYIEAIYQLISQKQAARVKDISQRLGVNYSSVTGALRALAERKLVNYAPYQMVSLTPRGKKVARDVIRRHEVLREFFIKVLAVDEKLADESACKMEHAMTPEIVERFVEFVQFFESCPQGGATWVEGLGYHCESERREGFCKSCSGEAVKEIKIGRKVKSDGDK